MFLHPDAPHEAAEQREAAAAAQKPTTQSKSKKTAKQSTEQTIKTAKPSPASLAEVHPDDEPALLVHARLNNTKLSTVIHANQTTKFNRDLKAILTAKVTDTLVDPKASNPSEKIGAGSREQNLKRKRAVDTRAQLIEDGKASHGQVKRARNTTKSTASKQTQ